MSETRFDKLFGIGAGTGGRPAAGNAGARWVNTSLSFQEYVDDGAAWQTMASGGGGGGGGLFTAYALFREEQTSGTNGGTATSGAWRTRVLNQKKFDTGSLFTLASNQISAPAGTYFISASGPAFAVAQHQAKLRDVSNSVDLVIGTSEHTASGAAGRSWVIGRFTLGATTTLELQHQVISTQATNGFGVSTALGVTEVFSVVELWKE